MPWRIIMDRVLKEFQHFYRLNSNMWLERFEYKESAQHLLLMAFLQRIVNAGGEIIREMALGNRRIDILVKFGKQEFALELKIKGKNFSLKESKEQLKDYLDILNLKQGYLLVFDPAALERQEKILWKKGTFKGKNITYVGL